MSAYEVNFDGLVGPTHNYAGLSFGNVASTNNKNVVANPKLAALQGLEKAKALADMGFKQGILPPQERPCIATLRQMGFSGSDADVITQAATKAPRLLANASSASSMWVANAATVSPSADTLDGKVHFTPANLNNKLHRSIEHEQTGRALAAIFTDAHYFAHHPALPMHESLGDEGAANHNRFSANHGQSGVELFVYGQHYFSDTPKPSQFPARHSLEASQAIARLHGLSENNTVFLQQNPDVIDQGVFHNDVIAVSNGPVFFHHQDAFLHQAPAFDEISRKLAQYECEFHAIEVPRDQVSISDAVQTYLFNSQLLTKADGSMMLVVPNEAREHPGVWAYLQELIATSSFIKEVQVFDLRESMRNGGGPACLRLRVALQQNELDAVNPHALMSDEKYRQLVAWVNTHYRDRLSEQDLADPQLLLECRTALDELTQIMQLGSIYPFQLG
ncbi:N-succinylarginine dihydrolase [Vibrio nitrifigilis]|uniref:N-succinylarginine dihydrolase n=1 Tax=Vibrio nitrifigilis TaxID=2789781 RepID=A0ABS0GD17_9VIBR|nr:N-succinylarginine dihydrolase [Vibrio nitrifigilis]MBF9000311.1 N-succinylarginine dihydrolase [Vibrio nitrifigilis]